MSYQIKNLSDSLYFAPWSDITDWSEKLNLLYLFCDLYSWIHYDFRNVSQIILWPYSWVPASLMIIDISTALIITILVSHSRDVMSVTRPARPVQWPVSPVAVSHRPMPAHTTALSRHVHTLTSVESGGVKGPHYNMGFVIMWFAWQANQLNMPKSGGQEGEIPLPPGWEFGRDYDNKLYFIDHNTQKTTWVDPRDR